MKVKLLILQHCIVLSSTIFTLNFLFRVVNEVNNYFQPDAIVCQCGVDGLAGDPMNSFNLTQCGLGACVHYILSLEKPLLLLGGGICLIIA